MDLFGIPMLEYGKESLKGNMGHTTFFLLCCAETLSLLDFSWWVHCLVPHFMLI